MHKAKALQRLSAAPLLFVFPKSVLIAKEIVSDKKEGKRAIRIYSPWDITMSKQAQKTQKWQLDYFLEIQENNSLNIELANQLLTQTE